MNRKIQVIRAPKRGAYDKSTIYDILDSCFLCHVGFVHDKYPVVIPTLFGRKDDNIYIHGSSASRMVKDLSEGIDVCITVTRVDGLVLARSAYHHSMNYASVVMFGKAQLVPDAEKEAALKVVSDHILDNRWEDCRLPNEKELKATKVLSLKIDEASAKIRQGPPLDEKEDYELSYWAGVVPIAQTYGQPIPDPLLNNAIKTPDYLPGNPHK